MDIKVLRIICTEAYFEINTVGIFVFLFFVKTITFCTFGNGINLVFVYKSSL